MRTSLDNMFRQIREYFGRMEKKARIKLGILTVVVIVLAVITVALLSRTNYMTLHVAQTSSEAGQIIEALREIGEPYEVQGTRILVPEGRVAELRVLLAAQGIIGADEIDYDMLETAAAFNVTTDHATKIYEAQAARELRTQILAFDKIQSAIVTVNFGEYSPFVVSQGVRDATAGVVVVVRGGAMLTMSEAQSIAEMVRGRIPGIKYENISITDSNLNHYKVGDGTMDLSTEINSRIALRNLLQQQIQIQGEQLLAPIFGMNNLQVTANVKLNFDRQVTETVEFDPPIPGEMDGIVRSSSELYENQRNAGAAEGIPGTDTNAVGTVEYPYGTLADGDEYRRAVIEKNYEINETRKIIEYEQGVIEELSIAVLLDNETVVEDYSAEVINLVAKGLGISPDDIAVERLPFSFRGPTIEEIEAEMAALREQERRKEILQMVIMWAVILLLGLAFISLIKTIVRAVRGPEVEELVLAGGGGIDYIADDDYEEIEEYEEVELNTKPTGLEQIEKFIDKDPSAVAQLLRNWLTDD